MPSKRIIAPREDEPDLIEQALRGNSDAFSTLCLHYLDGIYRYLYF
jgi:hypothetical protein